MKHCVAAVAVGLTVGLAGCDDGGLEKASTAPQETVIPQQTTAETPALSRTEQGDSLPGAPDFVSLYPGATAVTPQGQARQVTFTTDALPDTVIEFYRQRAESSGLRPTAAMNQGGARAYGASDQTEGGHSLQVIAAPTEEGATSVQLSWNG